jgi:hypothetical protein
MELAGARSVGFPGAKLFCHAPVLRNWPRVMIP